MDLFEYRKQYINQINADAASRSVHPDEVFIEDVTDRMINDFNILGEPMVQFYCDEKFTSRYYKSMKVDAVSVDRVTNTVNLLIADYNTSEISRVNNEAMNTASNLMINYFDNVLKGYFKEAEESSVAREVSIDILKGVQEKAISKIHLYLISTNVLSEKANKRSELQSFIKDGITYKVDFNVIDMNMIYKSIMSSSAKEQININTIDFNNSGIPCIKADIESDKYDSYLAIVPGEFLADIYDKYETRLLESNVRCFLSFRGAINKGIRGTILNAKHNFFTYNNGISATARKVELDATKHFITRFEDLQIVNGGQTTASLSSTRIKDKADLKGIYVQMKLTVVSEDNPDFVRNISKFANSQNKVTNADLTSNHPFFNRIEELSRKILAPLKTGQMYQEYWFFERTRGQYEQPMLKMTQGERDKYLREHPKNKKFTKMDLAKYFNSANMLPYFVSWGAEVNATKFQEIIEKQWEKKNDVFNEHFYRELVGMAILFKHIEQLVSNQDWYQADRAYRAQIVTYTFSKFVCEAAKESLFVNYKGIWNEQKVPDELNDDLAGIAKLVYDVVIKQAVGNVSSYCKQKQTWDNFSKISFDLSNATKLLLLSKTDKQIDEQEAAKEQRKDNLVSYNIEIFKKGVAYWDLIKIKGEQQRILTQYEIDLIDKIKKNISKGIIINHQPTLKEIKIIEKKARDASIIVD